MTPPRGAHVLAILYPLLPSTTIYHHLPLSWCLLFAICKTHSHFVSSRSKSAGRLIRTQTSMMGTDDTLQPDPGTDTVFKVSDDIGAFNSARPLFALFNHQRLKQRLSGPDFLRSGSTWAIMESAWGDSMRTHTETPFTDGVKSVQHMWAPVWNCIVYFVLRR